MAFKLDPRLAFHDDKGVGYEVKIEDIRDLPKPQMRQLKKGFPR